MYAKVREVLKEILDKTDWKTKSRTVTKKQTMEKMNSLMHQCHEILD